MRTFLAKAWLWIAYKLSLQKNIVELVSFPKNIDTDSIVDIAMGFDESDLPYLDVAWIEEHESSVEYMSLLIYNLSTGLTGGLVIDSLVQSMDEDNQEFIEEVLTRVHEAIQDHHLIDTDTNNNPDGPLISPLQVLRNIGTQQ